MGKLPAALLVAAFIALTFIGIHVTRFYDASPRFLTTALLGRLGIESSVLDAILAPPEKYSDRPLDGVVLPNHPRILLPGLGSWNGHGVSPLIQGRIQAFESRGDRYAGQHSCGRNQLMNQLVC